MKLYARRFSASRSGPSVHERNVSIKSCKDFKRRIIESKYCVIERLLGTSPQFFELEVKNCCDLTHFQPKSVILLPLPKFPRKYQRYIKLVDYLNLPSQRIAACELSTQIRNRVLIGRPKHRKQFIRLLP